MSVAASTVDYLKRNQLVLTTAESCTAGKIVTLLSQVEGSGSMIESGYVVYSPEAKQRLLGVRAGTIETFNLTSCEVVCEMARGALRDSPADVAVASSAPRMSMAYRRGRSVLPGPIAPPEGSVCSVERSVSWARVRTFNWPRRCMP